MATYFMFRRKAYAPEIGPYHTYDIVVYEDGIWRGPAAILRDVSVDGDQVFDMVLAFNRLDLDPIHLKDAVLDLLE